MIMTFAQVALGGAIGACLRFGAGQVLVREGHTGLPVAILTVNVLGSFAMGLFAMWSFHRGHEVLNLFVMTGILGGFTTFSAFSLEAFTLIERGQIALAGAYVALSVGLSIGALVIGASLARAVWA
jgi:CrcB protein